MKCKYDKCDNEVKGRSKYCSDTCKTLYNRNKGVTETVTSAAVTPAVTVSLEHYRNNPAKYCTTRTNPDLLNWDEPMSAMELHQAGLTANRVPIPGDHDYQGVCSQVEGQWVA